MWRSLRTLCLWLIGMMGIECARANEPYMSLSTNNLANITPQQSCTSPDIHSSSLEYRTRFRGQTGRYLIEIQSAILAKTAFESWSNIHPKTFVDIGGGHGQIVPVLVQNNFIYGVVQGTNKICSDLLRYDGFLKDSSEDFIVSDLTMLPFEANSFSIVSAFRMMSHYADWKSLVAEMARLSSYRIVIDFAPKTSFNLLYPYLFKFKKRFEKNTRTFERYSLAEIRKEFARYGFELHAVKNQFFLPVVIHRVCSSPLILGPLERLFAMLGLTRIFGSPSIAVFQKNS